MSLPIRFCGVHTREFTLISRKERYERLPNWRNLSGLSRCDTPAKFLKICDTRKHARAAIDWLRENVFSRNWRYDWLKLATTIGLDMSYS